MRFKKGDIVIFVILIAAGLSWFGLNQIERSGVGGQIVIQVDGQPYKSIPFEKGMKRQELHIELDKDRFIDIVADGEGVHVEDVICPDKLCKKTGTIDKTGQSIVCLPNKVVVFIEGKGNPQVDNVSY